MRFSRLTVAPILKSVSDISNKLWKYTEKSIEKYATIFDMCLRKIPCKY